MPLILRLGTRRPPKFKIILPSKSLRIYQSSFAMFSSDSMDSSLLFRKAAAVKNTKETMKEIFKKYGKLAVITYASISILSCTSWYFAFKYGLDIGPIKRFMTNVNIPTWFLESKYAEHAPLIALAWSAHTVIFPIRLGVTAVITRLIANSK